MGSGSTVLVQNKKGSEQHVMRELICLTREPFLRVSDMDMDGNIGEGPTQLCDVIGESTQSSTRHKDSDSFPIYMSK